MFLAQKLFVWDHTEKQTLLKISHGLAWDLIHNPYYVVSLVQPKSSKCSRKTVVMYEKATCPTFTSHWKGKKLSLMLLTSTTNLPAGVMVARNGFGLIVYATQALGCVKIIGIVGTCCKL